MARKNMKTALSNSIKAENEAVKDRFERAESLLGNKPEQEGQTEEFSQEKNNSKEQTKKDKVIRDSFTLPSEDYELITELRQRCLKSAFNATKSEVIRAGLHALTELTDEKLLKVLGSLTKVKTGRPAKKA